MKKQERSSKKPTAPQGRKFVEAAREVGASEDPLEFERILRGIAKAPPTEKVRKKKAAAKRQ